MKYSIAQKVIIILIMVLVITILVIKLFKNKSKALSIKQEMMTLIAITDGLNDELNYSKLELEFKPYGKQEGFTNIIEGLDIGKEIRKSIEKPLNKVKDALEKPLNEIKKAVIKPVNDIVKFVKIIEEAFNSIPIRANNFLEFKAWF